MLDKILNFFNKPKLSEKEKAELSGYEKKRFMEKAKKDIDKRYKVEA